MQKGPNRCVWRGLSLCLSVRVRVCEVRPGCCPRMGSHRQAMVVMGSVRTAAGLRDRLGQVLQACVASGNLIRVLIACFVLRRMPCGPGASHASVGLTALEESVCPAEVWSLLVLDLRRRGDALWLLYVMRRISNDLLWLAFSYCVLLVV